MDNNNGLMNGQNGNNPGSNGQQKEGLIQKVQRGWNTFSTTKGGRWAIRGAKGLMIGLGLYKAYDAGKRSVKPTLVYVRDETTATEESTEPETETNNQEETATTENAE